VANCQLQASSTFNTHLKLVAGPNNESQIFAPKASKQKHFSFPLSLAINKSQQANKNHN
jgi:hypothetical protein